jgi:hypothetical protein
MNHVSLKTTDQAEMEFDGELLFSEAGNDADGSTGGRWHDISVFREASGEMVVAVGYRTQWPSETNRLYAERADTVDEADALLSLYEAGAEIDPLILNSLPEPDRKRLTGRVINRFDMQVNSVLSQLEAIVAAAGK